MSAIGEIVPPVPKEHDQAVGRSLRALRKRKGVSLQVLSAASGLSIGYISQIERGISSASVRALALLTDGLNVGLDAIFLPKASKAADANAARFAFSVSERRSLGFWRDGIEKKLLTPSEGGDINLFVVHVAPGGCSGEAAYTHTGTEAGFVLTGSFSLIVDGQYQLMNEGDAFRFRSNRPHMFHNDSEVPCQILWVLVAAL
jgi:transcriptional regulator with XRE-family HTH domain